MRLILFTLFIISLLIHTKTLNAQGQPSKIIVLKGLVTEMGTLDPVKQLPLHIEEVRPFATDNFGSFEVPVPFSSGVIKIELRHPGYEIMAPPEGSKLINKEILPNSNVNITIWVLGSDADESLKNQLKDAQSQVKRLQQKNQITGRQLEKLNQTLLDTINSNEIKRKSFILEIETLNNQLASTTEDKEKLEKTMISFEKQMNQLKISNAQLLIELTNALEEKYLKQKGFFEHISKDLLEFVSRLKDYHDQLTQVKFVFKNYQAGQYFSETVNSYSHIRNELNKKRESHFNAITHYWESNKLATEYDKLMDEILKDIHDTEILPLNQSVIVPIQEAATGKKPKIKKIEKIASSAAGNINDKIAILEPHVQNFLTSLREF